MNVHADHGIVDPHRLEPLVVMLRGIVSAIVDQLDLAAHKDGQTSGWETIHRWVFLECIGPHILLKKGFFSGVSPANTERRTQRHYPAIIQGAGPAHGCHSTTKQLGPAGEQMSAPKLPIRAEHAALLNQVED